MRKWSKASLEVRATLDPRLQKMVDELLVYMDVSLRKGHRTKDEQNALYPRFTKVKWPNSKHNTYPSVAVDIAPYPYPENELELWASLGRMAGLCTIIAERNGFQIRWGGDWDRDGTVTDNDFDDLFHVEIYE